MDTELCSQGDSGAEEEEDVKGIESERKSWVYAEALVPGGNDEVNK